MTTATRSWSIAARFDADVRRRTARARERFLTSGDLPAGDGIPTPEIQNSWLRSQQLGVDPNGRGITVSELDIDPHGTLLSSAEPVLADLAEQCRDSDAWGMVLDRDCVQITPIYGDRRVVREGEQRGGGTGAHFRENFAGTNGAGLSLERLEPFLVVGEEHFRAGEHGLASVGVPLRDVFGRMVGFFLMCQRIRSANHMIVPYTQATASAITERINAIAGVDEHALFDAFARHSRRPSLPVIAVSAKTSMANNSARQMLRDAAQSDEVRSTILDSVASGGSRLLTLDIAGERYRVHSRAVELPRGQVGAVASLSKVVSTSTDGRGSPGRSVSLPTDDPVLRARRRGLAVLIVGEPGVGRSHRLNAVVARSSTHAVLDAAWSAHDPQRWLHELENAVQSPVTILRHIDQLDESLHSRVKASIARSRSWVAATAAHAPTDKDDLFPVVVRVAPLRERRAEIPRIVDELLHDIGAGQTQCTPEALSVLSAHSWPGNVVQMRRVLASAVTAGSAQRIDIADLPADIAEAAAAPRQEGLLARAERELLFEALRDAEWNREAAAKALGISRATIYRRIRQFGFQVPSSR